MRAQELQMRNNRSVSLRIGEEPWVARWAYCPRWGVPCEPGAALLRFARWSKDPKQCRAVTPWLPDESRPAALLR
jgi:hypothetical protein